MKKFFIDAFLVIVVSSFAFSYEVTFLPSGLNSKMILAGFGIFAYLTDCIQERSFRMSRNVLISGLLAVVFSVWCLFSVTVNGSNQHVYDNYFTSFFTWLAGAYGTVYLIRKCTGKADINTLTRYLTLVLVSQCTLALLIDNVPAVHDLVQAVIRQSFNYYERGGRLYGIGYALDPAGVRNSAILVLIAYEIALQSHTGNNRAVTWYFLGFIFITIVGCMVSRTTLVGSLLGLAYILVANASIQQGGYVSVQRISLFAILTLLIGFAIFISAYLYNTNSLFREDIRFGFEGFFNWAETGEWYTNSTNVLENMWIWPDPGDRRTWLIGAGVIGVFQIGSDIGYCNFVFYCGLIGLTIYSVYFLFNHLSLSRKFNQFFLVALMLCAVTFIVWRKVQTDIFFLDALLFCLEADGGGEEDAEEEEEGSLTPGSV